MEMLTPLGKVTKNHWPVYLQWVGVICKMCLSKVFSQKQMWEIKLDSIIIFNQKPIMLHYLFKIRSSEMWGYI